MLTLTCTAVELVDHSGDTRVSWSDPAEQLIVTGGDFTVTRVESVQRVEYRLEISPIRTSHTGTYTCHVEIPSVRYSGSSNTIIDVNRGNGI